MDLKNTIEYNGEVIPYEITRAKIKNLYIYIKKGAVIVRAPFRLKEKYIYDFIEKKSKWIYEKIKQEKEEKVIEYVVLHEMCHLKHMNHSKAFWDLVESNMPEYKEYKKILKQKG